MSDPAAPLDDRRESLLQSLRRAQRALSRSDLGPTERFEVRAQLEIISKISAIQRPDWGHIECLTNRLLWKLGDRVPAVTAPLCVWIDRNATRYRTVSGSWRIEKSDTDRRRAQRLGRSPRS